VIRDSQQEVGELFFDWLRWVQISAALMPQHRSIWIELSCLHRLN
jgi:hypothetical protein